MTHEPVPTRGETLESIEAFAARLPAGARLIGIDAGTRTLGLALSAAEQHGERERRRPPSHYRRSSLFAALAAFKSSGPRGAPPAA